MMKQLKIGVLGAGHLGKIHLKLLSRMEGWQLMGFYDPDPVKSREAEDAYRIKAYPGIEALVADCDAVDVVTPTLSHFHCAMTALQHGKHVFIEKPVTRTPEEAKELMQVSGKAGVTVQVGHVERFNPAFTAVRNHCSHPLFIEGHRLAEFNPRGTDVSVVLDLMIHDIDIVLSLVSSPIKSIHASGVAVVSDTPDIANARILFDNGCVANLTASRISMKNMRKCRFFQKQAYISVDFLEKKAEVIHIQDATGDEDPFSLILDLGEKGRKVIHFEHPEVAETNAIGDELAAFRESILQGGQSPVTMEDGYRALDTAWKISEIVQSSSLS